MSAIFFQFTFLKHFINLTAGGDIEILVAAAITKEDARTFEFIFDFVLTICPQLSSAVFVLLVDGDRATWLAARVKFEQVCSFVILSALLG